MRLKTLALCSTALLVGLAPAAQAQVVEDPAAQNNDPTAPSQQTDTGTPTDRDAPTVSPEEEVAGEGQDIVVTGFRESLASSRNLKRNAPQVVDAVVAEDIGKLPDLAVSDTASRIPGLQVLRLGGEASQVLLRGLDEQFFNTLYNGREIFTAERRQVALQDFPSAGIAALEVFKTSTANQVDPGVIGLTNVRSRRPFDFEGFELSGTVFALHTVNAGKVTPNGNLLVSNRWDTGAGEFGILLNASYTELDYLDSEPSNTDFLATPTINGQQVRFPDVQRLFYRSGNRQRPSFNGSIQWRPTPDVEFYIDGLYQGFRNRVDDTLAAAPLFNGTYSNLVFRDGTNLLRSGTVVVPAGGPTIFSFRGGTFNKTDTYQFAAGGIFDSGPLRITADVARTNSTFTGSTESVDRQFGIGGYTVDFDLDTPQFRIYNYDASNPATYRFDGLYEEQQEAKGDDWQARIDAEYKFDEFFIRSIQVGARYTTRDAHREFGNRFAGYGVGYRNGAGVLLTQIPVNFRPVEPGFNSTDIQPFRTFLAPTYDSIRANRRELRQFVLSNPRAFGFGTFTLDPVAPNPDSIFDANEKTYAGYGQINYNFNDVIDGSVGIRVARTEFDLQGNALVAGVVTPISASQGFTDYLPNASLRWRITPALQLRLSYTETRTRATFQQLNPAANVGAPDPANGGLRTGSGGNPTLSPIESENYDASLEYYFSRTGFAAVTAFRRDLTGFIQNQAVRFTDPTLGFVEITRPVNSRSGRIDGVEAQVSTFFDFEGAPEFLRSFGIQANYTYLDAETDLLNGNTGVTSRERIQGVAKHTYNIVGLFERGPLSARVTYNKRSRFLDQIGFRGDDLYLQEGLPPGRLDLSTNLTVNPNVTVFFDATNLTAEEFEYTFSSARAGAARAEYVRFLRFDEQTFSLGLRFRL
ncbi:TonB-dependent receptor [Sphingomonas lenta]|uniref:TonB-dependent receptor n=1 Tax=Sphingomonas lenta TaxID=1141887 RepID=A0A2A2SFU1_9SPHN|nr:TonB-dependent receptor [Sphingomonas lenta]PAX08075.1 hypothetical protein CKY28_10825 [Sphingomonas lenta]